MLRQVVGMILFVGPDFMTGCPNMVPHNVLTCVPGFSLYEGFYFWFGVVVNIVWGYVPLAMMRSAIQRSVAMKETASAAALSNGKAHAD